MTIVESIRGEYTRYKALGEAAIAQLSDDQLAAGQDSDSNSIAVDVPNYFGTKVEESDRKAVLNAMEQIGKIARTEMGTKVEVVTRLTVTFGKGSKVKGETVSLN